MKAYFFGLITLSFFCLGALANQSSIRTDIPTEKTYQFETDCQLANGRLTVWLKQHTSPALLFLTFEDGAYTNFSDRRGENMVFRDGLGLQWVSDVRRHPNSHCAFRFSDIQISQGRLQAISIFMICQDLVQSDPGLPGVVRGLVQTTQQIRCALR